MHVQARRSAAADSGRAPITVLTTIVLAGVCAAVGFYVGRNILGEQYLKRGAAKLKARPTAYLPSPGPAIEEPVVEEPPPPLEPVQREPPPPRAGVDNIAPSESEGASSAERASPPDQAPRGVMIQLGCFLNAENAKALLQDLRNRGYTAAIAVEKQGQSTLHRVLMGPLPPERARALAADLQREGYEALVIGKG